MYGFAVPLARLERATCSLGNCYSIQLSYKGLLIKPIIIINRKYKLKKKIFRFFWIFLDLSGIIKPGIVRISQISCERYLSSGQRTVLIGKYDDIALRSIHLETMFIIVTE